MGKIDGIVDGGDCAVGVESTIIDLTVQPPRLLRPGGLPLEALEAVLGTVAVDKAVRQKLADGEKAKAPGMKYRHYAPRAAVTVVTGTPLCCAAASRARTKFLAPGSTGCAVTSTTITCPVETPRRHSTWRSRPVPRSSS